jgi:hypothetical protein
MRAKQAKGQKNVQHTNSADETAKGRVQDYWKQGRKVAKKIILLPKIGPGQIEQQRAHLKTENNR